MSKMDSFVHLHVHSEYSLLDGAIRVNRLLNHCEEHQIGHVALTDNGNLFGAIDFYFGSKKRDINPILGVEIYLTDDMNVKNKTMERLILLCQNNQGYENLCHIVSDAHLKGFYYNPRIDLDVLKKYSEGIIVISPGYWGPIAQMLQLQFIDKAKEIAEKLNMMFPNRFYFGIQRTGELGVDQLSQDIIELSKEMDIPLVALNDVYFLKDDEGWMQDLLQCIKTGREVEVDDQNNSKRSQHYFRTTDEMIALFSDVPEAIENTVTIANQCHVEIKADQVLLPRFDCPDNLSAEDYLKKLVWEGIHAKYDSITTVIKDRVQFELDIINKMQYPIYFLIIYDFLAYCDQELIPVGPGRGSAAGSIVAYALNITRIDPMAYNLLFERFLNPERVTMPDIDIDFCIRRRGEVIDYISKKYGSDHVAQIITFGTMAARGVVRDVGRALAIPLDFVDRVAKLIPSSPGHNMSISEALEEVDELSEMYQKDHQAKQLLDYGQKLEGFARHSSTHAAGVVISRDPLSTLVPLMNNDGQATTHYTMNSLETMGLLKMDILGLRNLTVIREACDLINKDGGSFNIDEIEIDDKPTYDLLCTGETIGVFQCESPGMRRLIVDLQPKCFEDIIALLALYRPGPLGSGMVSDFISNKSGKTKVKYDLPKLEPILKDTYGMIVYQEQVMQIASAIGGFTLGESDMLRRAMGKKKKDVMDQMKDKFLVGAKKQGFDPEKSEKVFDLCYKFAEYGFNKSHSAAYALVSFQTAYLKAHHPKEYLLGLLNSVLGNTDRTAVYVSECKRMKLEILPPNVNQSFYNHHLEDDVIYFGLGSIKGVGEQPIESLIKERKDGGQFESVFDFFNRLKGKEVNKRVVEHLIKAGALDCIDENRAKLLGCFEEVIEKMQISSRYSNDAQVGLFQGLDEDVYTDIIESGSYQELSHLDKLRLEKELTGEYLTAHPLDEYAEIWKEGIGLDHLDEQFHNESINTIGILSDIGHRMTKNNRPFSMGTLEDFNTKVTVLAFESPGYETIKSALVDDVIVKVSGKVKVRGADISIMLEEVTPLNADLKQKICHVDIMEDEILEELYEIRQICLLNRGQIPLYFHVQNKTVEVNKKYWIKEEAISMIESIIGEQKVWIEQ